MRNDNDVAMFAIFCIFGLPIAAWILFRIFGFIERMAMINRGIVPPPSGGRRAWRSWQQQQQSGWTGAPWQQQAQSQPQPPQPPPFDRRGCGPDDDVQSALFKGIRLSLIGLAILIGLSFIGGTPGTAEFRGGPWLLGGLIPMFVGIAQVIIALLSGAQLPGVTGPARVPPPGPGAYQPPPPPPPGSPGAPWARPAAPHYEELAKPTQPPDLR
ncbi:MAG TPA: hypothetical protein VGN14_16860 [Candidatus Elarobacter sp.]|jgi:hypothetical protein